MLGSRGGHEGVLKEKVTGECEGEKSLHRKLRKKTEVSNSSRDGGRHTQ